MFDSYGTTTLRYYPDRCINCGRCSQVCPHRVFSGGEKRAVLVQPSACMECGACSGNCPVHAIEVESGVGCAWAMISAALRGKDPAAAIAGNRPATGQNKLFAGLTTRRPSPFRPEGRVCMICREEGASLPLPDHKRDLPELTGTRRVRYGQKNCSCVEHQNLDQEPIRSNSMITSPVVS
jgi:ferredoxin